MNEHDTFDSVQRLCIGARPPRGNCAPGLYLVLSKV